MSGERGFTIVEALTAMAILAIALVVLYGVGADTLKASKHIAAVDRAALFAQSKLDMLALASTPLPAREDGQQDGFRWSITAEDVSARSAWDQQILQNVQLVVTWRDGLNERSLIVVTRHLGRAEL